MLVSICLEHSKNGEEEHQAFKPAIRCSSAIGLVSIAGRSRHEALQIRIVQKQALLGERLYQPVMSTELEKKEGLRS